MISERFSQISTPSPFFLQPRKNKPVAGSLAVTRALGDAYLKTPRLSFFPYKRHAPYITARPEVNCRVLTKGADRILTLASDGVWERASGDDVLRWVRNYYNARIAGVKAVVGPIPGHPGRHPAATVTGGPMSAGLVGGGRIGGHAGLPLGTPHAPPGPHSHLADEEYHTEDTTADDMDGVSGVEEHPYGEIEKRIAIKRRKRRRINNSGGGGGGGNGGSAWQSHV